MAWAGRPAGSRRAPHRHARRTTMHAVWLPYGTHRPTPWHITRGVPQSRDVRCGCGFRRTSRPISHADEHEQTPAAYLSMQVQGGHGHVTHGATLSDSPPREAHDPGAQLARHVQHVCGRAPVRTIELRSTRTARGSRRARTHNSSSSPGQAKLSSRDDLTEKWPSGRTDSASDMAGHPS